ncbi:MAG TPA: hypothetical protein GXZ32_06905 [Clostridiales bacterium]|nr:hypothetical protein [Clostridiales bacterium]
MDIKQNIIIPLGYGKYFKSEKITGFQPIEEDRGPGRRTYVYVEGIKEPIIASRTEEAILKSLVNKQEDEMKAMAAMELLEDLLNDLQHVGPMLRKSIKQEARIDLDNIEDKIKRIMDYENQ